jgi:hypothetical protein
MRCGVFWEETLIGLNLEASESLPPSDFHVGIDTSRDARRLAGPVAEKGYQKMAWVLLVIIGVVSIIFGVASILPSYQSANPYSPTQLTQRDEGVVIIGFGLFGTAISYKPFRSGERWAWYVALYVPVAFVYLTVNSYSSGGTNWPFFVVLLLVDLAGLLLPYRKFFPK